METSSGVKLRDFYIPEGEGPAFEQPGDYPFTRGRPRPGNRTWTHRELSGEGSPTTSNRQFHHLIDHGANGVDVIGDMPTQAHMDADHPMARMSVGTNGVSLCTLEDFHALYKGLPFDRISVSHSTPPSFTVAGLFLATQSEGVDPSTLRGSVLQVPLYTEDCAYATHLPIGLRMRLSCDSISFCSEHMPKFHGFIEDTYYISDGGMDPVTEMALGFVEIRAIVKMMQQREVSVDSFAPRIGILVNCRMDLFEEVAKIRATRRIFARMMREEFGAENPRSWAAPITVHTSGLTLTAQQPINNVVRGTLQALAMVLADVDALEISTFDEAFRTPSPESHVIALRTQQIIALESGAAKVRDPLGGSYYIEELTDQIERLILRKIDEIEALGDPTELVEDGHFRSIFEGATNAHAAAVARGERMVVGVTDFVMSEKDDTILRSEAEEKIRPALDHVAHVKAFKSGRDMPSVRGALRQLFDAGMDRDAGLMEPMLNAYQQLATMGEIAGVLRESYGMPFDPFGMENSPR